MALKCFIFIQWRLFSIHSEINIRIRIKKTAFVRSCSVAISLCVHSKLISQRIAWTDMTLEPLHKPMNMEFTGFFDARCALFPIWDLVYFNVFYFCFFCCCEKKFRTILSVFQISVVCLFAICACVRLLFVLPNGQCARTVSLILEWWILCRDSALLVCACAVTFVRVCMHRLNCVWHNGCIVAHAVRMVCVCV